MQIGLTGRASHAVYGRKRRRWRHRAKRPRRVSLMSPTLYLPIKLNNTILPKVGVFIPEHFQPKTAVDLIVYFHGNIASFCETEPEPFKTQGIEYYLDTPLFRCLREELDASTANAILIAPTLSTKFGSVTPSWSPRYGNLNEDGKFDFLITDLDAAQKLRGSWLCECAGWQDHPERPFSRRSGDDEDPEASNALKAKIAECWGFECLYFGTDTWETWLSANPNKQFRHFRQPGEQKKATNELKSHGNFIDVPNGSSHCTLLKEKWREAIDKSGTLHPTDAIA
jgi:hypothetical protein